MRVFGVHAVADLQGLGGGRELVDELLIDLLLHQEARRRDADLAGIAELARRQHLHGRVDIGVLEDDARRMAAELHGGALHVQARERRELLADRGRAREGHLADDRDAG